MYNPNYSLYGAPVIINPPAYGYLVQGVPDPLEDPLLEMFQEIACQSPNLALIEEGETDSESYLQFNGEPIGHPIGHYINLERCFPPTYGLTSLLSDVSIPLMKAGAIDAHIYMKNAVATLALSLTADPEQQAYWISILNAEF